MDIDKKNIAFVVLFFAIGLTFILVIYSISSNRDKVEYEGFQDDPEEKEEENELLKDPDVQTLFEVFSKLDTDRDSIYINKNKYDKESDLSNEEKLFVVFKTISNREFMNIDCDDVTIEIPEVFVCTNRTYGIHRGVVMARYDELFGFDKEIELNNFLTYVYDPDSLLYYYLELKDDTSLDDEEYDFPKAVLKDAYTEDGRLKIKYYLDYSLSGNSFFDEEVTLTFKRVNNNYIFVNKKVEYSS